MYIFCKSFPPLLSGDGRTVERYSKYTRNDHTIFTIGLINSGTVFCLSRRYDTKFIMRAIWKILHLRRGVVWVHSTALAVIFYPFIKIKGHKLILTTHGLWGLTPLPTTYRPVWLKNKVIEYLFFKIAKIDLITTVDPYSQRILSEYQSNVVHIPSGVDFDIGLFRSIETNDKEEAAIFLGRHFKQKNLELVTKMGEDRLFRIYAAGSGPLTQRFMKKWADTGEISYLGVISDEEKNKYLTRVRFLLQPSLWEGFPLTILEALAHKTIPIIRDYADLKKTELCDFLIVIDESNFISKIHEAKKPVYDWDELEKLLSSKYSWEKIVEQYDELFSTIKT